MVPNRATQHKSTRNQKLIKTVEHVTVWTIGWWGRFVWNILDELDQQLENMVSKFQQSNVKDNSVKN